MSTELASNATAKLEPFLLMSKSAKGAAAAKLVENATSAPGVFIFAELLELPNIQEVRIYSVQYTSCGWIYVDSLRKEIMRSIIHCCSCSRTEHMKGI